MEREIEFRGLTTKDEWVYGSLVLAEYGIKGKHKSPKTWIISNAFSNGGWFNFRKRDFVKSDTVGQFTGMKDKNNNKVYEGDILKRGNFTYVIKWSTNLNCFALFDENEMKGLTFEYSIEEMEIVNNISFLKKEEENV